jgi:hypothetical protein
MAGENLPIAHQFIGSAYCAPPEQIEGDAVDGRADVYALATFG